MPVSLLPILVPILLAGIPLLCGLRGRKAFLTGAVASMLVVSTLILMVFIPGWVLQRKAGNGDPEAMYELARWSENHVGELQAVLPWPGSPDTTGGFPWLEKAAARGYPPAVCLGVRLKYGDFVPMPRESGTSSNQSHQPERGQTLIDRALELGYKPTIDERRFYWAQFRR
jgi:hypothetical protein